MANSESDALPTEIEVHIIDFTIFHLWLPKLGEQGKIINYYFAAAKSTKQGVIGTDLSVTHNDYAS